MKIAFHLSHFSIRGTEVAAFDYASLAEEFYGHESIIIACEKHPVSERQVEDKFRKRFRVETYSDFSEVNQLVARLGCDVFYIRKSGENDGRIVEAARNAVHAVFPASLDQVHGERYAFNSSWLARHCAGGLLPDVPHAVSMPNQQKNLRDELSISNEATVVGCHGGQDSFDIAMARRAVEISVEKRRDLYFLFLNINKFIEHERVLFMPGKADVQYKADFIGSCDAMLHARLRGETFGLACAEFSVMNKPVITFALSPERMHLDTLGSKALKYRSQRELEDILLGFDKTWSKTQEWDCYSDKFSPAVVMKKFSDVFLSDPQEFQPMRFSSLRKCAATLESKYYERARRAIVQEL